MVPRIHKRDLGGRTLSILKMSFTSFSSVWAERAREAANMRRICGESDARSLLSSPSSSSSKSSSSSASSSSLLSCSSSSSSNSFACDRPGRKPARPAAKSPSALATSSVPASLMTPSRGPEACAARRCTASGCPRAAACKYHERRLTSKVSTMSQPSSSPHSTMAKCSTSPSQSGAQELPRAAAAFSAINMRGESSSPMAPPATRASARWASNGS
mmetsp:Transcript_61326/g.125083  ORF Transcript_61326/g.125083 Transcript_61326/m.125083 type:complete len:216 (+) Transcript_61326:146-793(+)